MTRIWVSDKKKAKEAIACLGLVVGSYASLRLRAVRKVAVVAALAVVIKALDSWHDGLHHRHDPSKRLTTLAKVRETFTEGEIHSHFRFYYHQLEEVLALIDLPSSAEVSLGAVGQPVGNSWNMVFYKPEMVLVCLARLAYPSSWSRLIPLFGLSAPQMSVLMNWTVLKIRAKYEPLFVNPQIWHPYMQDFADKNEAVTGQLDNVWAWVDGTNLVHARPGNYFDFSGMYIDTQRAHFNGKDRHHTIKFQCLLVPNGLCACMYGPVPGSRHDAFMLLESGIEQQIRDLWNSLGCPPHFFVMYGDPAYPLGPFVHRPFKGAFLTANERGFNGDMKEGRISVENLFGVLGMRFQFLDFQRNLQLFSSPIADYFFCGMFFNNVHACLHPNQISLRFECPPPSLAEYFAMLP
jgi:hypothetical protein